MKSNMGQAFDFVTPSPEDLDRAAKLERLTDCPRRYCWWWQSLAFDWDTLVAEGCTYPDRTNHLHRLDTDKPCSRWDASSGADHYEPREPHLEGDGFHRYHFLPPERRPVEDEAADKAKVDSVMTDLVSHKMPRASYGVDCAWSYRRSAAHGFNRFDLLGCAVLGFWSGQLFGMQTDHVALGCGTGFMLGGLAWLWYSRFGKLRARERLLGLIEWTGTEQVLDVGCGRGLMLIGAAR